MKKLIILCLLFIFTAGQAQIIQLEEATINYSPRAVVVSSESGKLILNIPEEYRGQFVKDPLKYMKESFDILPFIANQKIKYDTYQVDFRSNKGYLVASFDKKGQLVRTSQKFKDIDLPIALKREIYLNNKGWSIAHFTYTASGKLYKIDKELYNLKLVNGKEAKRIKIRPIQNTSIVSN